MSGEDVAGCLFWFCVLGLMIAGGVLLTSKSRSRATECELRFELAATPTDSLTVMREHTYCEVGS